jgi:hypothetical protein
VLGTEWTTDDIWLRRTVELDQTDFERAFLDIHHDEDAEVYVNGQLVASFSGYTTSYILVDATERLREVLRPGANTLAVHCKQTVGGQFIDVGLRVARGQ